MIREKEYILEKLLSGDMSVRQLARYFNVYAGVIIDMRKEHDMKIEKRRQPRLKK